MSQTEALMTSVEERIKRGMDILDERRPGWVHVIDVGRLKMENYCDCVLGQLFGDYGTGRKEIGLSWDEPKDYGFGASRNAEEEALTAPWIEAIEKRRSGN